MLQRFASPFRVLALAVLGLSASAQAQSWVTAVEPAPHAISAPVDAPLTVTFSEPLDAGTVTPTAFRVTGDRFGAYPLASATYDAGTQTVTLTPADAFGTGEGLLVTVTTVITNAGGTPMPAPYVWRFSSTVRGGSGSFNDAATLAVGSTPYAISTSDFNGDGHLDLATVNRGSNSVSVLDGDGVGGFAPARTVAVGTQPEGLVAGDWNSDGAPDLATANAGSSSVTVLLNNGDGTFAASTVTVGAGPHTVRAGDLNGDGHLDLVTSEFGAIALSLLLGDGAGGFTRTALAGPGGAPELVMIQDADDDGDLDLIAPSFSAGSVRVFTNDGGAGFTGGPPFGVGAGLHGLCAGDVTGDGLVDVLGPSSTADQVYRLTGDGIGGFLPEPSAAVPMAWFCRTGDLDGDHDLDVAVTSFNGAQVFAWRNDGTGTFDASTASPTGTRPHGLVLGDWDEDGDLDLATANDGSASVTVLFNEGTVSTEPSAPDGFGLHLDAPFPNPAAATVVLGYTLDHSTSVTLTLLDLQGRELTVLGQGDRAPGRHRAALDTTDLPSGHYLLRLSTPSGAVQHRVTVAH